MNKDSIIDFLGFVLVKLFSAVLCCMPLGAVLWIGRRGGDLARLVNVKRRSIAYANLKSAFPEKDSRVIKEILKSHYRNLGASVVELLKLPIMGKRYLNTRVRIENFDRINDVIEKGKGVILLAAHFGNWEMASLAISARGKNISVFVRKQKYVRLNRLLNQYREMSGSNVITKGFSIRDMIGILRDKGVVAMLVDQDAGAKGVFVDFLNRSASTAQGPISFAVKTGAVILPTFPRRVGHADHILEIGEPLKLIKTGNKEEDMKANLRSVTDIFEDRIKRFPDQWLWSHKRWKSSPQRTVLVLDDGKAGHLNQAFAAAEMVKEALGAKLKARGIKEQPIVKIEVAKVEFKNKLTRRLLDMTSFFAGKRCQGCLRCMNFCLKKESFNEIKEYADIVISCGASIVAVNVFLKYENNAKSIVIMKPGLGRSRKFELVVLPRHDAPARSKSNMLITDVAPNRIRDKGHGTRDMGVGLLVGGDAKNFKLKKENVENVIDSVLKIGRDLFVSTSRRTSPEIDKLIKEKLSGKCKSLIIANENNKQGAVQEIFDKSEVIIVSPESISMISEAVSSGRRVVVFRDKGQGTRDKYGEAVAGLEASGYIKTASPDKICDVVKQVLTERSKVRKLEDREKILERLVGLM